MVLYICNNCNKKFNHLGNYKTHLNKKKVCKITIEKKNVSHIRDNRDNKNVCKYCEKEYKHKCHLNRHLKTGKNKEIYDIKENIYNLLLEEQNKKLEG